MRQQQIDQKEKELKRLEQKILEKFEISAQVSNINSSISKIAKKGAGTKTAVNDRRKDKFVEL